MSKDVCGERIFTIARVTNAGSIFKCETQKKEKQRKKILSMGENENASQQCDDGVS